MTQTRSIKPLLLVKKIEIDVDLVLSEPLVSVISGCSDHPLYSKIPVGKYKIMRLTPLTGQDEADVLVFRITKDKCLQVNLDALEESDINYEIIGQESE